MVPGKNGISVLRLGYRPHRDARVNTHICLTARALGANSIFLTGEDSGLARSIEGVVSSFGGDFQLVVEPRWRKLVREFSGITVHLSMYGDNLPKRLEAIQESWEQTGRLLVIVGGEKVPKEIYEMVDFNIAIGNQPHSEIAALAIFLDRLLQGKGLTRAFPGAKIKIDPYRDGKKQVRTKKFS